MSEYIKREACCADCIHYCVCKDTVADENWNENAPKEVREMFSPSGCENYKPTADVVEVRHGKWKHSIQQLSNGKKYHRWTCSLCGRTVARRFVEEINDVPYCHCGAKMDGKVESK